VCNILNITCNSTFQYHWQLILLRNVYTFIVILLGYLHLSRFTFIILLLLSFYSLIDVVVIFEQPLAQEEIPSGLIKLNLKSLRVSFLLQVQTTDIKVLSMLLQKRSEIRTNRTPEFDFTSCSSTELADIGGALLEYTRAVRQPTEIWRRPPSPAPLSFIPPRVYPIAEEEGGGAWEGTLDSESDFSEVHRPPPPPARQMNEKNPTEAGFRRIPTHSGRGIQRPEGKWLRSVHIWATPLLLPPRPWQLNRALAAEGTRRSVCSSKESKEQPGSGP